MDITGDKLVSGLELRQTLRYGENPHQEAGWFAFPDDGLSTAEQLQGKELSYNNLIDLDAAVSTVQEFAGQPGCVVIKHTNPCGAAIGDTLYDALVRALDADRISCFGGIIALNGVVDAECAGEIVKSFYECIVAPLFSEEARVILSAKKNLRLLELDVNGIKVRKYNLRSILGGILVQEKDNVPVTTFTSDWKFVTEREPTMQEVVDLTFAWKVVRHVRSNAIVVARQGVTLGVGAGQMNRVGSAKIALTAKDDIAGAVLASDGFFPFGDTVRTASEYGIKAVIQPGGSIKDQESIDACNELGMTMVCTGKRHFLH
jgi:phosphoribosylaminoimidazolecarboxamide formyltransferase/IMP cyclohydrolase